MIYARIRFLRRCQGVSFSSSCCEPCSGMLPIRSPEPFGCADVQGVSHPGVRFWASVKDVFVAGMSMRNRLRFTCRGVPPLSDPSRSVPCAVDGLSAGCSPSSCSFDRRSTDTDSHGMDIDRGGCGSRRAVRWGLGDSGMEPESVGR